MPARGERAAPTFDKTKPRELIRFFEELEYLFSRTALEDESEKKKHVLRYVEFDVEQIWKTFSEYSDGNKTYTDFKNSILIHYPDASGDYVYSLRDMDLLVGERQRIGISTTTELTEFHLRFLSITTWLIEKAQLGVLEQQRNYLRAFPQRLMGSINTRLQTKFPDQHPNVPYEVKDVYEAARFILQSAATAPQNYFAPTAPNVNPPFVSNGAVSIAKHEPSEPSVKKEEIGTILAEFSKTIIDAINQLGRPRYSANNSSSDSNPRSCNFCGGPHFIRECDEVDPFIKEGKCKRNVEGKIVLPSGAFVPREITGTLLKERINEWHRRHPNQLGVSTLLNTIELQKLAPSTKPQIPISRSNFQLSTDDRIATIEAELFNLRSRRPRLGPVTRANTQKARAPTIEEVEDEDANIRGPRTEERSQTEESDKDEGTSRDPVRKVIAPAQPEIAPRSEEAPEHPYQNVKDAAYAPPASRNVGAPVKAPTITRKNDPAYKTLPPVHDPSIATEVYKRSMDTPITITQRELLSLSPEVRSQVRDVTTTRRVPNNSTSASQNTLQEGEPYSHEELEEISTEALAMHRSCRHRHEFPPRAVSQPDSMERYIRSLPPGQEPDPDRLAVAKESSAVRSIFAIVDAAEKKECILDSGCQIVAMAEDICHELSLVYDPTIKLNMQSANGTTDWSLGLARNVPFTIGTITLYLQVHIIHAPAYDILLGRPFEILTEMVTRNFANGDQTITITDPNTDQRHTIPTVPRGHAFSQCKAIGLDFHIGRN